MNKQNSELKQGEAYGLRYCLKCHSDAVAPNSTGIGLTDEEWAAFFVVGVEWPKGKPSGECECGHIGMVGRDIIDATLNFYRVLRQAV